MAMKEDGTDDDYEYVVHIGFPKDGRRHTHIAIQPAAIMRRAQGDPGVFGFMAAQLVEHCVNVVDGSIVRDKERMTRDQIRARIEEVLMGELGKLAREGVIQ